MAAAGYKFRDGNPYAARTVPVWKLLLNALPFMRAAELVEGPPRLRYKAPQCRHVPPILDERPLDIYRTTTAIYSMPYRIPRAYVAQPEQVGAP